MIRQRLFKVKSAAQMEREAERKGALKRTLGPFGLTCVGVGMMLGAGIFIAPGDIAKNMTGPAVCIAYLIAVSHGMHYHLLAFTACCIATRARLPTHITAHIGLDHITDAAACLLHICVEVYE